MASVIIIIIMIVNFGISVCVNIIYVHVNFRTRYLVFDIIRFGLFCLVLNPPMDVPDM